MDTKRRLGIKIKALRRVQGLSQTELAEMVERTVDAISAIERGKSLPNIETLERLSEALNLPIAEFFETDASTVSPKRAAMLAEIEASLLRLSDRDLSRVTQIIKALVN